MDIIKIVSVSVISVILTLIVKENRPEYAPFVQISGLIAVIILVFKKIEKIISDTNEIISSISIIENGYFEMLVKILGIAIITKIAYDICIDNSNTVLADCVELAGKVLILIMCMPLLNALSLLAKGILT